MSDSPFAPLLELQLIDTHLTQANHKMATLPERAALQAVEERAAAHRAVVAAVEAQRHAVQLEQKRFEDELATLEAKLAREDAKLYSGTIQTAKELQSINDEVTSLKHRQSDFEDRILEALDRLEPLDAQLAEHATTSAALDEADRTATAALAEAEAAAQADIDATEAQRAAFVAGIAPEHLALYDKLRHNVSGNAVAALTAGSCTGCHLSLPSAELERIRHLPVGEPAYCEECGALLVP